MNPTYERYLCRELWRGSLFFALPSAMGGTTEPSPNIILPLVGAHAPFGLDDFNEFMTDLALLLHAVPRSAHILFVGDWNTDSQVHP